MKDTGVIILAGGEGTRFNQGKPSGKPKVLYEVDNKPLINYSLEVLEKIGVGEVVLVVGYKGDEIKKALGPKYKYAIQEKALGTGDATSKGLEKISINVEEVMVLYGADIYSKKTLENVLNIHSKNDPQVTFVTKLVEDPAGFGRIVRDQEGQIKAIVEEKVATDAQKRIKEINDGCYVFEKNWLSKNIGSLSVTKVKEYFLTDLVESAIKEGSKVETYTVKDPTDWIGVDSFEDIKNAQEVLKDNQ